MNNLRNKIPTILSVILTTFVFFFVLPVFQSNAGTLDAVYFYLSRIEADLDGTSGNEVEYVLAFAPNQSFSSGGQIDITFPLADDTEWCRTAGSLTITAVSESAADMTGTTWAIDSALPNSGSALAASCTQGNGTTTVDTISITNVGALTAGTTYGVQLENGSTAGVLGTSTTGGARPINVEVWEGTTIDSNSFQVYLLAGGDQVEITATVSDAPSVTCSISTTTVDIGTLYPGGSFATASHTISTSSSGGSGYYWASYGEGDGSSDAGLYNSVSAYLIASTGNTNIDLTGANAQGFGMTVSDPDTAGSAVVPVDFQEGTLGQFGALDRTASGARLILYQPDEQGVSEDATITYGARANASAASGSYTETVTFVCGGYY